MLFYLMKRIKRNMMNIKSMEMKVLNLIFPITLTDEEILSKCSKSFSKEISVISDSTMMMMTIFLIQVLNLAILGNLCRNLEGVSLKVFRKPLRLCKIIKFI